MPLSSIADTIPDDCNRNSECNQARSSFVDRLEAVGKLIVSATSWLGNMICISVEELKKDHTSGYL